MCARCINGQIFCPKKEWKCWKFWYLQFVASRLVIVLLPTNVRPLTSHLSYPPTLIIRYSLQLFQNFTPGGSDFACAVNSSLCWQFHSGGAGRGVVKAGDGLALRVMNERSGVVRDDNYYV